MADKRCTYNVLVTFIEDASWVVSAPKFLLPISLHLLASELTASLSGLSVRSPHTLPFGFNPGDAMGTQGIEICLAEVC